MSSRYSFEDSVVKLKDALATKHVKLFCVVDHSGEAIAAGLQMRPTTVLLFGSPQGGTPLMISAPSTALDLPLRILVAEEEDGRVLLSWNDPVWIQERHGFPETMTSQIGVAELLARSLSQ